MSDDSKDNLIDFGSERGKRIHELHDKRLDEMRKAFEQALPLPRSKSAKVAKSGKTPKKR